MMELSIESLFPQFLLNDKNGYALAKAIETALEITCNIVQTGIDTVLDVDTMPEWRLDEMAGELGCLYDYTGTLEQKRKWIRDSTPYYAAFGTKQAIYNYLIGVFDAANVEEFWEYQGNPFRFRVTVGGEWTVDKAAWAMKAIAATKNVRSLLDNIAIGHAASVTVIAQCSALAVIPYPLCGTAICGDDGL